MAITVESDLALPRDPTSPLHAATKQYVDSLSSGIQPRATTRVATVSNITISTALNNADVIDGITLATGDRVLVKNQTLPQENGIYDVAVTPVRSADMDAWTEVPGAATFVQQGTAAEQLWVCTSDTGGTLNTTAITWVQFSSVVDIIAAGGIGKTANTLTVAAGTGMSQDADGLSIDTAVVPQKAVANTFTAAQTIDLGATGTPLTLDINTNLDNWINFTEVGVQRGFLAEISNGMNLTSNAQLRLASLAGDITIDSFADLDFASNRLKNVTDPAAAQDAATRAWTGHPVSGLVTGDGSTNPLTFTHNLNTRDIHVMVRTDSGSYVYGLYDIAAPTVNTCTIGFATALANAVTRRVIVIGIQG